MDILTQHNNAFRTGSITQPGFSPQEPTKWRLLNELPVDGAVYAQPLYVEALKMSDGAAREVAFVATANNTVYAFDLQSFWVLWKRNLGPPDESDTSQIFF